MELIDAIIEVLEDQDVHPIHPVALDKTVAYWIARDVTVETLQDGANCPSDDQIYLSYDVIHHILSA